MTPQEQQQLLHRLFALREARTTSMADAIHVQPTSHYTDVAHHEKEVDRLFRHGPLIAALSCELVGPNAYLALDLAGVPVALVRGADGVVRAFLNACRHRGAQVLAGRGVAEDRFRCPYHAWSYDTQGRVSVRPGGPDAFNGLPGHCQGLLELPVQEACGLIVVNPRVGGEAVDVAAMLGPLAAEFEGHGFGNKAYFAEHHSSWTMNWKQPYETFLEAYHIFALHKDSLAREVLSTPMLCEPMGQHGRGVLMGRNAPNLLSQPVEAWRFSRHANLVYWLFPNTVLSMPMTDHVELWQFYPEGVDRTRVHVRFYTPQPLQADRETEFWKGMVDFTMGVVTNEDFAQQEAIFKNLRTGQLPELYFGRNEPALIHYHESLARALAA